MTALPSSPPSRLRRFACMMYEAVLLFAVAFLAGYVFDTLTQSNHALMLRHERQAWLFIVIGVYFILCWRKNGQTLPMKTWNIRLQDHSGRTPSTLKLMLRYLLIWPLVLIAAGLVEIASWATGWKSVDMFIITTPFAIFIWSWFDRDGQFLHDRLLGMRLINASPPPSR